MEKMDAWCIQTITSVLPSKRMTLISDLTAPTSDRRTTRIHGNLRVCLSPGRATIRLALQWRRYQPLPESALLDSLYAAFGHRTIGQLWATEADEPPIIAGNDEGPNPVEHLLHALASCLTTSMVAHPAVRQRAWTPGSAMDAPTWWFFPAAPMIWRWREPPRSLRRTAQDRQDVLGPEVGDVGQDLLLTHAAGQGLEHVGDGDACAGHTRFSAAHTGCAGDQVVGAGGHGSRT